MLRLLEHYASPQGEGPRVGIMSQFVRFAGCNLRCPGWPCDTQQAIDPKLFTKEQVFVTPEDLIEKIIVMNALTGAYNVVFTGGEPMMQTQGDLRQVVEALAGAYRFEIFTNGTRPITPFLRMHCDFVIDWKLPGSGEDPHDLQRIDNIVRLAHSESDAVKFVITSMSDLTKAYALYDEFLKDGQVQTFVGAAWDKFSNEKIVAYIKAHQLPWRLNVQVHNYIFGAQRRFT